MAITVAGMSPSHNGDSHKARSPSADESARRMEDAHTSNWGFKSEGISAFTGGEGSAWHSAERRRQTSPEAFTNPYIEMRRKRSDMRMIRYQLASYGQLPLPQRPPNLHQSLERRIRTPDREWCLNISQVSPYNECLLSQKLSSSEKDQLELTPEDHEKSLVHRDDGDSSEVFMVRCEILSRCNELLGRSCLPPRNSHSTVDSVICLDIPSIPQGGPVVCQGVGRIVGTRKVKRSRRHSK